MELFLGLPYLIDSKSQGDGMRKIRVAVIGAGPAGIYAADILTKEYEHAQVDVFDRLPAPYGLVRYGVFGPSAHQGDHQGIAPGAFPR